MKNNMRYTIISAAFYFLSSSIAYAAPAYVAPKAEFELVKEPAAFTKATNRFFYNSGGTTEQEIIKNYSATTKVFVFKRSEPDLLEPKGSFDKNKKKIEEIGRALGGAKTMTVEEIYFFNQALSLDGGPFKSGAFPGDKNRICLTPFIKMDSAVLKNTLKTLNSDAASVQVTIAAIPVHAGPDEKSTKDKKIIVTLPAKIGIILLDIIGNGYEWNAKIITPSGKTGYIDQNLILSTTPGNYCFGKQPNGEWLIDTIIRIED